MSCYLSSVVFLSVIAFLSVIVICKGVIFSGEQMAMSCNTFSPPFCWATSAWSTRQHNNNKHILFCLVTPSYFVLWRTPSDFVLWHTPFPRSGRRGTQVTNRKHSMASDCPAISTCSLSQFTCRCLGSHTAFSHKAMWLCVCVCVCVCVSLGSCLHHEKWTPVAEDPLVLNTYTGALNSHTTTNNGTACFRRYLLLWQEWTL